MAAQILHSFRDLLQGIAGVFDPRRRPWIISDNVDKESIIAQVKKSPSGALSIEEKKE